jgi:hypothetical protein
MHLLDLSVKHQCMLTKYLKFKEICNFMIRLLPSCVNFAMEKTDGCKILLVFNVG